MLIVFDGTTLHAFDDDCRIKPPNICVCDACDIACGCPPHAHCMHHRDGTGGMCVSRKIADTEDGIGEWVRVAHFQTVSGYSSCNCPYDPTQLPWQHDCQVAEPIVKAWLAIQPGPPRTQGAQRRELAKQLHANDRVDHAETEPTDSEGGLA